MRVLLVTPWPLDSLGGTQTLARNLAAALHALPEVEVSVVTGQMPGESVAGMPVSSFPVTQLPLVRKPRPRWMPYSWRVVGDVYLAGLEESAAAARPDALVYFPHHSPIAYQVANIARSSRVAWCLFPLLHPDHRRHVNRDAARLYRSADLIACCSERERDWMVGQARVAPDRAVLLGLGSEAADRPFPGVRWPRPGETVELLTVAEVAAHKRITDQVEALALLRGGGIDARLTVAGVARDPGARDELDARIRRLGLESWVSQRRAVPEAEMWGLYTAAHCFLFTSASESYGLALLDAICTGTIPIAYPHPVYRRLVESSEFGAVTPAATPRALADTLRRVLQAGEPPAGPAPQWLAAHTWSHVAATLAGQLARVSR